jgi:uncharacterized membrane protein
MTRAFFRIVFSLIFIGGGINHFAHPEFYLQMMPPYIPAHELMIQISGVAEVGLGILLNVSKWRSLAGWGLVLLLIAVLPANIHMATHAEQFTDFSAGALWVRVLMQIPLILWGYSYARKSAPTSAG